MDGCECRDWAAVEYDVLGVILSKVESLYDHLQFSVVCKSWYFIALRYKHQRPLITSKIPQLPMLIVPSKDGIENQHSLYDPIKNKICPVDFKFRFNKRCCGSSFGWLIMLEETLDITLFNPFYGTVIRLPPINMDEFDKPGYDRDFIVKAIVTKDPSLYPNDYMVVAIYSSYNRLCLIKANHKSWIYHNKEWNNLFHDVNVCNDTLYVLDGYIRLWKVEVENRSISLKRLIFSLKSLDYNPNQMYLVQSSNREIFLVGRFFLSETNDLDDEILGVMTSEFLVYKLTHECEDGIQRVVEVESLDGDAMFIGDNQSMSISTKDFPQCLPNRIYFTDDCHTFITPLLHGPQDVGIYNLEDKSFGKHYVTNPAHRNLPPPIWIVPTICSKDFED